MENIAAGNGDFGSNRHKLSDTESGRIRTRIVSTAEPSAIAESASFVDDLDADSLALIELVEALEEDIGQHRAGFHIDDEDLQDLRTVRDAVDYVVAKL